MRKRTRWHVLLLIGLLVGFVYGRLSLGWSDVALIGGMAGILLVTAFVGMPWLELAPDGAWRRRPQP